MDRGEPLERGMTITTDGTQWSVTLVGEAEPVFTFERFADLIEWIEDQHEGYLIGRMYVRRDP